MGSKSLFCVGTADPIAGLPIRLRKVRSFVHLKSQCLFNSAPLSKTIARAIVQKNKNRTLLMEHK